MEIDRHGHALIALTGKHVEAYDYAKSIMGLHAYLQEYGIRNVSGRELATHAPTGKILIPPRIWWPRGALLCVILESCRIHARGPIHARGWYRPPGHNQGGALLSKHLVAAAIDMDFKDWRARRRALNGVLLPMYRSGLWAMGLGIYKTFGRSVHVDVLSRPKNAKWGKWWGLDEG